MDGQEFVASVDYVFVYFFPVTSSKLIIKFNFLSHQLFFAYYCRTYSHKYKMTTPSSVCILLLLFAPSAILLNFSVNTLLGFQYCFLFLQVLFVILEIYFLLLHILFRPFCLLVSKIFIHEVAVVHIRP